MVPLKLNCAMSVLLLFYKNNKPLALSEVMQNVWIFSSPKKAEFKVKELHKQAVSGHSPTPCLNPTFSLQFQIEEDNNASKQQHHVQQQVFCTQQYQLPPQVQHYQLQFQLDDCTTPNSYSSENTPNISDIDSEIPSFLSKPPHYHNIFNDEGGIEDQQMCFVSTEVSLLVDDTELSEVAFEYILNPQ